MYTLFIEQIDLGKIVGHGGKTSGTHPPLVKSFDLNISRDVGEKKTDWLLYFLKKFSKLFLSFSFALQ